jgi:DNA gyrase subunit A
VQGRGGLGIKVAKLQDARGDLAGSLIVEEDDEVLVVLASGKVVRSAVAEVPAKGRDTMGVVFARFADEDRIIALAKNTERNLDADAASDSVPESAAAVTDTDSDTTESRAADQGESEPDGKEESTNE